MNDGDPGVVPPLLRPRNERDRIASSEVWTGGRAGPSPAILFGDGAGVLATRSAGTARVGCVLMSGNIWGHTMTWGAVAEVSAR